MPVFDSELFRLQSILHAADEGLIDLPEQVTTLRGAIAHIKQHEQRHAPTAKPARQHLVELARQAALDGAAMPTAKQVQTELAAYQAALDLRAVVDDALGGWCQTAPSPEKQTPDSEELQVRGLRVSHFRTIRRKTPAS